MGSFDNTDWYRVTVHVKDDSGINETFSIPKHGLNEEEARKKAVLHFVSSGLSVHEVKDIEEL